MPPAPTPDPAVRASGVCPGCGALAAAAFHPFCSQGCRDRDLLQWLSDGYRLPIDDAEEGDEADTPPLDSRAQPPL